ncbi:MAG: hypothetical protein R3D67_18460 [Hyphomicrobiaceae bacterium]
MSKLTLQAWKQALAVAAVVLLSAAAAAPASAERYARSSGYRPSYVVAESHWGNGTARGPIRPGRHGWQVRLPRGTWIDCARSCTETLRRATVDFWESQGGNQSKDSGPGYFRWEFRY